MLYNKKRNGEIEIVDIDSDKIFAFSFHPSGGSSLLFVTKQQAKNMLGKNPMTWENGGNKLFMQAVFYPPAVGNTREDKNKQLKEILELEKKWVA